MYKNLHVSKWFWAVLLIALLSFLIKLPGLDWGFPGTLHSDESDVIRSSFGMRFGDLNPHHFDWPSFYFYINYFTFVGFLKLRVLLQILFSTETMQQKFPFWWGPDLPFYYISRMLASLFLSLNIITVYFLSNEYGLPKRFSFLASTIFAVGFWTNYYSFYGISDTALTFLITATAYFCIKILKAGKVSDYLLAGIFAGLTTSIKYNGAIMCLLIFIAHLMHKKKLNFFDRKLFIAAIASVVFFFVGTPYALLDWATFTRTDSAYGALWQIEHIGHGLNWIYYILGTTPQNFGWLAAFIGFYSIFIIVRLKNKNYIYLLISYLVLLIYVGSWGITRQHYALSLFPFFAIIIAVGLSYIKENSPKNVLYLILVCILIPPIISTATELIKRNNIDTRIASGNWVTQNLPKGSSILSANDLTGYYGGALPVFRYDEYKVYKINGAEIKKLNKDTHIYYLITSNDQRIESYNYDENNLIYELGNKWTTGPIIKIYKLNEANLKLP